MPLCNVTGSVKRAYAWYADEIDATQKCNKKDSLKFNRFTRIKRNCAEMFAESACLKASNPLTDLKLDFPETMPEKLVNPALFVESRQYFIYVSIPFMQEYRRFETDGGTKPVADITLFFGVGPEITLFGLRSFFEQIKTGVLITISGTEAGWKDYGAAWGIGIDKLLVNRLFASADIPKADWKLNVISAYSTGYRGFNGTVVNAAKLGLDLSSVKHAVYFDCLYKHDDHVRNEKDSAYKGHYTRRSVDTLIKANSSVKIVVYKVTRAGTPPGPFANKLLVDIPSSNLELVDLGHKDRFPQLRALCLARFIDNGVQSGVIKPKDLPSPIVEFLKLLPARGTLVTGSPGQGEINLDAWIKKSKVSLRIREIYTLKHGKNLLLQHMVNLTLNHSLLGGWESHDWHDMMHRYFVQELGKQHLV